VMFGSKRVGGVRLRIPTQAATVSPPQVTVSAQSDGWPPKQRGGESFPLVQLFNYIEMRGYTREFVWEKWLKSRGLASVYDIPEVLAAKIVQAIREKIQKENAAVKESDDVAV